MTDESGKMPGEYINIPEPPFEQLKVKDLTPEHGDRFIGVGDVAVDHERVCWVLLDAPVFGADMENVAPILIRQTRNAGYEVEMRGLSDDSNFTTIPSPDTSTWVRVQVV